MLHQFGGVFEIFEIVAGEVGGTVATKGEDVLKFLFFKKIGQTVHFAFVQRAASKVYQRFSVRVFLNITGDVNRILKILFFAL